jgi:hypothetical protein
MEDTRITFETAKLAKEKGFNERGHYFYKVKSENDIELYGCTKKQLVGFKGYAPIYHKVRDYHTNKEKLNAKLYRCSAPTQSLLAKWLREEHNIIVLVDYEGIDGYYYKFYSYKEGNKNYDASDKNYNTYEEAYEIGLQEALKLI